MGIPMTLGYIILSKTMVLQLQVPGLLALLAIELFILAPLGLYHLYRIAKHDGDSSSFKRVIPFRSSLSTWQYVKWSVIGIVACILCYGLIYPIGLHLREHVFGWLPEWYFNPAFGTDDINLVAQAFLLAVFIDGIVGPVVEELFFRGYLLPRMMWLKKWAPILNGFLFGIYHFWQPHNYIGIIIVGIIISYIVWLKKNVYLGIIIHCLLNIMGALSGYFAATGGMVIPR